MCLSSEALPAPLRSRHHLTRPSFIRQESAPFVVAPEDDDYVVLGPDGEAFGAITFSNPRAARDYAADLSRAFLLGVRAVDDVDTPAVWRR